MILGHTINTVHGYVTVPDRAKDTGADVYQIFYRSPHTYNKVTRKESDTLEIKRKNKEYNKQVVIHGSYLINFCRDPTDQIHSKGVEILVDDLNQSVKMGAIGVIIHMGKDVNNLGKTKSKENYIAGIKETLKQSDKRSTLILETGAGVGTEVSSSLEELGEIRNKLTETEKKRVKFCLDTCHMFAYGYNLGDKIYVDFLNTEIADKLGWENVAIIHLNDSKDVLGSHKDNHGDIGKGNIEIEGLFSFVNYCVKHKVPMVLETPSHYYNNVRFDCKSQMNFIREYHKIIYMDKHMDKYKDKHKNKEGSNIKKARYIKKQ